MSALATSVRLRVMRAVRQAPLVKQSIRYFAAAILEPAGVHRYTLRASERDIRLRHPEDSWTFEELLRDQVYALPVDVAARVGTAPVVADLGANIGLFGVAILDALPAATVTGYEPDPANARLCRTTLRDDIASGHYQLRLAAAGTFASEAVFTAGRGGRSRLGGDIEGIRIVATVEDVMDVLSGCDFVKVDIEGGEWAILQDPRFAERGPAAITLEYHPWGCPEADPEAASRALLEAAGYRLVEPVRVLPSDEFNPGQGQHWAVKR